MSDVISPRVTRRPLLIDLTAELVTVFASSEDSGGEIRAVVWGTAVEPLPVQSVDGCLLLRVTPRQEDEAASGGCVEAGD